MEYNENSIKIFFRNLCDCILKHKEQNYILFIASKIITAILNT